jgi:hypothetical protein
MSKKANQHSKNPNAPRLHALRQKHSFLDATAAGIGQLKGTFNFQSVRSGVVLIVPIAVAQHRLFRPLWIAR